MYAIKIGPTVAKKNSDGTISNIPHGDYIKDAGKIYKKAEKEISDTAEHYDHILRENGATDIHVGYSTNGETEKIQITPYAPTIPTIPNERQINDDNFQAAMTETPTYSTPIGNMSRAYQGNAAKTATSIKQGGMTKDELIDFNNRHPNETAQGV